MIDPPSAGSPFFEVIAVKGVGISQLFQIADEKMCIGYITKKGMQLSRYGTSYIESLKFHCPH